MTTPDPQPPVLTPSRHPTATLLQGSTLIYGAFTVIGLLLLRFGHDSLRSSLTLPKEPIELLRLFTVTGLTVGLLLVASTFFESTFKSYRRIKNVVMRLIGPAPYWVGTYLAVISGVGEELLFRGGIQPYAGIGLTAILFGLLHIGPDGKISAWSLWAMGAGLLLGWVYQETGNLWPPIMAHIAINGTAMFMVQKKWRAEVKKITAPKKRKPRSKPRP